MYRICRRTPIVAFSFLFGEKNVHDRVAEEFKEVAENETGWDRLKKIFEADEYGKRGPELSVTSQACLMGIFVGVCYGGFIYSKHAYMDFIQNNQATKFENHLDAKKKLQSSVTNGFIKGGFKWSWRLGSFAGIYVGTCTMVSAYRGKDGLIEHMLGGAAAGLIYNWNRGPRAWIVGSGLGFVLGVLGGSTTLLFLKLSGLSMKDVQNSNYAFVSIRRKAVDEAFKTKKLDRDMNLMQERTSKKDVIDISQLDVGK